MGDIKIIIWGFVLAGMLGLILGIVVGRTVVHLDAAKSGVAEWTCDPFTGHTEFRWKVPAEETEGGE